MILSRVYSGVRGAMRGAPHPLDFQNFVKRSRKGEDLHNLGSAPPPEYASGNCVRFKIIVCYRSFMVLLTFSHGERKLRPENTNS